MSRHAINLCDYSTLLDRLSSSRVIAFGSMLAEVCRGAETVEPRPDRPDEDALVLECDEERAEAICDTLRKAALDHGLGKNDFRLYREGPRGGWKRILWAKGPMNTYEEEGRND